MRTPTERHRRVRTASTGPARRRTSVEQLLPRRQSIPLALPGAWRPDADSLRPGPARERERTSRRLLVVADVLAIVTTLAVCIVALGSGDRLPPAAVLIATAACVAMAKALGLYDRDELTLNPSTLDETPRLFQLATLFALVLWLGGEPVLGGFLGRDQVLAIWGGLSVALVAGRMVARRVARRITEPDRCLLVGERESCLRAADKIAGSQGIHARVVAAITSAELGDAQVAAEALETIADREDIHRLVVAPGPGDEVETLDLVRAAKAIGLRVSVLPRMLEVVGSSCVFDDVEGVTLLGVRRFGLSRGAWVLKRATDLIGATLALTLLAPVFVAVAVAIRLDSRGPVFFRQQRVGRDGCLFSMVKFRTMVVDAEAQKARLQARNEADGLFKIADDPRITSVGRLLRRTSLDELPQLWNVLRGQMSLVGPRPLVPEDDERVVGWYRRRLHLAPGMTGRWQVLGSARVPLHEMVKLDYLYAANWSPWLDMKILLRTVGFVASRRGL